MCYDQSFFIFPFLVIGLEINTQTYRDQKRNNMIKVDQQQIYNNSSVKLLGDIP